MTNAAEPEPRAGFGRRTQSAIYRAGLAGRRPSVPTAPIALERAAQRVLSSQAFAYIAGSAGQEITAAANRAAFDAWQIVPRVLRDVSQRDLSITLLGETRATPFILSPIGVLGLARPGGDSAAARAAAAMGIPAVLSNQASESMEAVGRAADSVTVAPNAPGSSARGTRWFQLYWSASKELVASLVSRAERSGCEAIVVTLDTHILGWRPRDLDLGYLPFSRGRGIAQYTSDPVFMGLVKERARHPERRQESRIRPTPRLVASYLEILRNHPGSLRENLRSPLPRLAIETFLDVFANPALTWPDLTFLREHTTLPILLKGVLHPEDAVLALEAGVDGIVVSNHGGRQIDGEIPSLTALPGIVDAVRGRIPIILDSGVRSGADAFKALALGATAVGIGRPYVYGLALAGEAGVSEVLRNFAAELDITLGLAGFDSVDAVSETALRRRER